MKRSPALAPWSIAGVSFIVTICMTPVALGRPVFQAAGYGTLLWMLLAFGWSFLGTHLSLSLNDAALNPWADTVRKGLRFLRVPFYLMAAAAMLHAWVDLLAYTELPATPRLMVALVTAGLAFYAIRLGIENVTRVIGLIAIVSIVPLTILVLGAMPDASLRWLLPFPFGTGSIPWLWPTILFCPRGYDILPVFGPLAKGDLRRPVFTGVALGAGYLVITMVEPQLVFGLTSASQLPSPFLAVVETITSTYLPFQRIAFVSTIIWQMIVFSIVTSYSIAGIASLGVRVHPLTPLRVLVPWLAVVVGLAVVVLPEDVFAVIKNTWSLYGIILYFLLPALLLGFGRRRATREAALA